MDLTGSPPPMRGKAFSTIRPNPSLRITPAYAGKRQIFWAWQLTIWDHPRLCGEKRKKSSTAWRCAGSPPPMRGKEKWKTVKRMRIRITPAYAGKSWFLCCLAIFEKDHPRLCGEKASLAESRARANGSPPPMRGKVKVLLVEFVVRGITPAYAGKRL